MSRIVKKDLHVLMAWIRSDGHDCRDDIVMRTLRRSQIECGVTSFFADTPESAIGLINAISKLDLVIIANEVGLTPEKLRENCLWLAKRMALRRDGPWVWLPRLLRRDLHMIFLEQGVVTPDMGVGETLKELRQQPQAPVGFFELTHPNLGRAPCAAFRF